MLKELNFAALAEFDEGRIAASFDLALRRLEEDCRDRPLLGKARTITITLAAKPIADEDGAFDSVDLNFAFKESRPKAETKTYHAAPQHGQTGLFVNELSPKNARQGTIDQPREEVNANAG